METINIYDLANQGETAEEMEQLAAQIRLERHVKGIEELGIPEDGQPPKPLVGFQKVQLEPGESKTATIVIDPAATNHPFGVWCKAAEEFVIRDGEYKVYVGTSSEDTPFIKTITR